MIDVLIQKALEEAFKKMMEISEAHSGELLEDLVQICQLDDAATAEFKKVSQIKVEEMVRGIATENIVAALESVKSQLKVPLVFGECVLPKDYSGTEDSFLKEGFEKTAQVEREMRKKIMCFGFQKFFVSEETSKQIVDQMIRDATPA